MKDKTKNRIFGTIVVLSIAIGGYFAIQGIMSKIDVDVDLKSVEYANEYHATNTANFIADTTFIISSVDQGRAATLGSVVVVSTTAFWVEFYDATSTAAHADGTYTVKIATLESSITEGTYTFDIALQRGLVVVNETGYDGSYVITTRP